LVQRQPAVGGTGADLVPHRLVDADLPGRARGELLTGDEPVPQPAVDGGLVDAEGLRGPGGRS
jgi:hypothetical protein